MPRIQESMQTLKQFFGTDVPKVILHATLRTYILRLLLILSASCICVIIIVLQDQDDDIPFKNSGPEMMIVWLSIFAPAHHVVSLFPQNIIVPVWCDMMFTVVEVMISWGTVQPWAWSFNQYSSASVITVVICVYVQAIFLLLLFLIRVLTLILRLHETGINLKAFTEPFDFLSMCPERQRRGSRISFLTGRSVWRNLFTNESRTIVVLRGVSAIAIIVGMLAFVVTKVILEPIHEAGWVPSKLFSSEAVPPNLRLAEDSSWKIIVFIQIDEYADVDDIELNPGFLDHIMLNFQDAVDVKPLWGGSSQNGPGPDCNRTSFRPPNRLEAHARAALNPKIAGIEIHCPSRLQRSPMQLSFHDFVDQPSKDIWPDLLVRVNFPALSPLELIDNFFDPFNARRSTVYVAVGLTADRDAILANTIPIPLVSNAHLLGAVQVTIRQQFGEDNIASKLFGPPALTFLVAQIPYLLPDPSVTSSGNDDTATLRLYMQADASLWRFESDYRERSVWAGLSAVGGFWTALNGFFALLFGTSLLRILFDVKPLSTFGLLHKFKGAQLGEYPGVFSEGRDPPGLIAYLRQHFIDLSPVVAGGDDAEHELAPLRDNEASDVGGSNRTSGVGDEERE